MPICSLGQSLFPSSGLSFLVSQMGGAQGGTRTVYPLGELIKNTDSQMSLQIYESDSPGLGPGYLEYYKAPLGPGFGSQWVR